MKIEVGQVWSFNNQAELDWLKEKFKESFMNFGREKWNYETFLNSFEDNSFIRVTKMGTEYCNRDFYENEGYTILEVSDYMEGNQMFKVGDRVKVVKETYYRTEKHVGLEGKITWAMNDGSLIVDVGKEARYCHKPEGLELINQPTWQEVEREPKLGSRNDTLIVEQNTDTKELRLTTGCFTGTLDEFEAAVKRKPFGNKHRYDYEFYIERYKVKYPDYKKEVRYIIKLNDKCYFAGSAKIAERKIDALKFEFESNAQKFRKRFGGTIEEITLNK